MTQKTPEVIKKFEKEIPQRILNEDNPQYVLGFNTCRYLSKDFLLQALSDQRKEIIEEIEKEEIEDPEREMCSSEYEDAYNQGLSKSIEIIKKH